MVTFGSSTLPPAVLVLAFALGLILRFFGTSRLCEVLRLFSLFFAFLFCPFHKYHLVFPLLAVALL